MEELLSLKWNNHRSTFLHILGVLRDKQAYTDVTLACDGKFYSVHKLVLSTCSDYFCAMFEKTSCKSPVIVLKDIKSEDLEALLDYMYLGEVNVRQSDLASLIKAAENLRIKGLAVPDDEPPPKRVSSVGAPSRSREGGSGSPPAKRKRRDESEDGREEVRPSGGELNTPPPPSSRPKSPGIQRLSPSPHRTSQESHAAEDRDNRPHSSPAETSASSHPQAQTSHQSHQSLQSAQQLGDQISQTLDNQFRSQDAPFVKVEMTDDDADISNRDTYDLSSESFKEESDVGGELSNDLPEFLQQAASGALAGTSYHQSFAGPSGFQQEVSSWHGDGQSLPGNFPGMGFPPSSQDNPPGIGAEQHGNVCKVCGKVFNGRNWKQNLEYHFLTHTKEKPYKCPICHHSSALKYNLIRHIRNRHWDVLAPAFLNSSVEREGMEHGKPPILTTRDLSVVLDQSAPFPSEGAEALHSSTTSDIASQGNRENEGHLQDGQNQLHLNQTFQQQMSLPATTSEAQMSTSSSHQVSQGGSSCSSASLLSANASHHLLQLASCLNPLNINLDIPVSSGNQEMHMSLNRDGQLSSQSTSQENLMLCKEDNQMLMKKS